MGKVIKDMLGLVSLLGRGGREVFVAVDRAGGALRGVRLGVGHGARGRHDVSPFLRLRDIVQLWLCVHGWAALPDVLEPWWLGLEAGEPEELLAHLRSLRLRTWIALCLEAGDGGDELDEQPAEVDEQRPRP